MILVTDLPGIGKLRKTVTCLKKVQTVFYTVTISKEDSDTITLYVTKFYELDGDIRVTLNGRNLDIPEQTLDGFTIKGYGLASFNFEKIDWSYTVNLDTGDRDNVTATYTRP